jgi:hypothetical protein
LPLRRSANFHFRIHGFQRFYLVGSNQNQKVFRVLKIDRTEPEDLIIMDDKVRYTHEEIRNLLTMIDSGNKSRDSQQAGRGAQGGLTKCVSAFGIFGTMNCFHGMLPFKRF